MSFARTDTWIFDLDNTLYPAELSLFPQIEQRMLNYVMRELGADGESANLIRKDYWRRYGTTLAGLMAEHQIQPAEYLSEVHDIDFSILPPAPDLAAAISALPGRKLIHTNGDKAYARKVLKARGLAMFDEVYGVEETGFVPKPGSGAYRAVLDQTGINPKTAAFFDDDPRNLKEPYALGMRTILVGPSYIEPGILDPEPLAAPYIQYQTDDLTSFLEWIVASARGGQSETNAGGTDGC